MRRVRDAIRPCEAHITPTPVILKQRNNEKTMQQHTEHGGTQVSTKYERRPKTGAELQSAAELHGYGGSIIVVSESAFLQHVAAAGAGWRGALTARTKTKLGFPPRPTPLHEGTNAAAIMILDTFMVNDACGGIDGEIDILVCHSLLPCTAVVSIAIARAPRRSMQRACTRSIAAPIGGRAARRRAAAIASSRSIVRRAAPRCNAMPSSVNFGEYD